MFDVELIILKKHEAGPDAKAPAVYLNDAVLAEIKGVRDGSISTQELAEELDRAGVPRKQGRSNCSSCC